MVLGLDRRAHLPRDAGRAGHRGTTRSVFDIFNINVMHATPDPFGSVLYGALQLKASLLRTVVYKSHEHPVPVCVWLGDIHAT